MREIHAANAASAEDQDFGHGDPRYVCNPNIAWVSSFEVCWVMRRRCRTDGCLDGMPGTQMKMESQQSHGGSSIQGFRR